MRYIKLFAAFVALMTISACLNLGGGGGVGSYLTFTVTPNERTIQPGQTATFDIRVITKVNINANVALSVTGLPAGVTASFSPAELASTAQDSVLTLTVGESAPEGFADITITARELDVAGTTSQITRRVTIVSGSGATFALSCEPEAAIDMEEGQGRTIAFFVTRVGGFSAPVAISISGATDDFTATAPTPSTISGTATGGTFVIRYTPTPPVEQGILITVTATGGGITKQTTVYCRGLEGPGFKLKPRSK